MSNPFYTIQPGIGSVGSYQISAMPWVSSSVAPAVSSEPLKLDFPNVTRFIIVKNTNPTTSNLRIGFSKNGVMQGGSSNYFLLGKGESFQGELRVTELFLLSDNGSQVSASVIVGLTGIEANNLPNSWSGSSGVG